MIVNKINMKAVIVSGLREVKEIKKIASDYPTSWNVFPSAIYRTNSKPKAIDSEGNELQTTWTVTIELYSNNSLTDITDEVLSTFGEIGFFGTQKDANTADLKRVVIELSAVVDNITKYVYSK